MSFQAFQKTFITSLLATSVMFAGAAYAETGAPAEQTSSGQPPADTPIQRVIAHHLMSGYPDGHFHAEKGISRAELASILVKAFELNKRNSSKNPNVKLLDVPDTYWAYPAIQDVLKTDIMEGYHKDDRFYPNQQVTRAEGFAIFAQAYGVFQFADDTIQQIMSGYSDTDKIPAWAYKAMATALHEGFVNTIPEGGKQEIRPLAPLTRGDIAYALSQYLDRQYQPAAPFKNP